MSTPKRTSLNLDDDLIADVKIALLEAQRLGIEAPKNVSAFTGEAIKKELVTLRQKIDKARAKKA